MINLNISSLISQQSSSLPEAEAIWHRQKLTGIVRNYLAMPEIIWQLSETMWHCQKLSSIHLTNVRNNLTIAWNYLKGIIRTPIIFVKSNRFYERTTFKALLKIRCLDVYCEIWASLLDAMHEYYFSKCAPS